MPEEHLLLGRSTKDKAKDKKQKKAGKKVKEKPRDEREKNIHADSKTTTTHEKTHVEFEEPEAEFINDRPPQKEDVSVKLINDLEDQSETLSAADNLKHAKHVKASSGKGEKLVGNKLSKLSGAKGEKEVISPKQEKSSVVAAPKQEKSSVVAAPKQEKSSVVAAVPATVLSTFKLEDEEGSAVCLIKTDKNNSPKVEKAAVKVEKPIMEHGTPPLSSKERSKKKRSELATLHQMIRDDRPTSVACAKVMLREYEGLDCKVKVDRMARRGSGST
uniref:(California timema) hypothetical protein n=1 Tax=Timema californicum TaxID=61474 RepID=A0A7R9IX24_TIMCA|nr:unnamed protein product [Timema californicum]